MWVEDSSSIVINNNIAGKVFFHPDYEEAEKFWKFIVPGVFELASGTSSMTVTNNIAFSGWHHGYQVQGHECDDNNPTWVFENNVAHSISGYGAVGAGDFACTAFHDFTAYKCYESAF